MSNDYINNEIDKIYSDSNYPAPKNEAMACAWILGNFKGINLKVMDMSKSNAVAKYYVIGSATNTTQAAAMASEVIKQVSRCNGQIISKEGMKGSDWILIDATDVIVHIFQETSRDIYGLEELWSKSSFVEIPSSYYFSNEPAGSSPVADDKERDFF